MLFRSSHAYGVAVTDDLRQAVLQATGENLNWFWDEWMYQAGYPEFTVTAAWDSAASSVALSVKQTQVDTAKADSVTGRRITTPLAFRMPVTIRVGTAAGDVVYRSEVNAREQTITIPGVTSTPSMVVFDDGDRSEERRVGKECRL